MDDKTVIQCCTCVQTCCFKERSEESENQTETNTSNSTSTSKNSTNSDNRFSNVDIKNKITQAAGKVEGFFKKMGQNIKQTANSTWNKVKVTATKVEETGIKINFRV
jgi:2C-methyl-D-erythritol 2,4-cyclodiphosphate synthase